MALLYVEKLFKALTPDERKQIDTELRQARSPMLYALYNILVEFEKEGKTLYRSKSLAFKRLYGRAYSAKEDYLFRNECRMLASRLEQFLAQQAHQQDFEQNKHRQALRLLEALAERQLWSEFNSYYEKSRMAALRACEFEMVLAMDRLYVKSLGAASVPSASTLQQTLETLKQSGETLQEFFAATRSWLAAMHAVTTHYLQQYGVKTSEFAVPLEVPENLLSRYFDAKARAFGSSHGVQSVAAEQALETIMLLENETPKFLYEKMSAMVNLGLAYMLNAEYEQAQARYAQAISFCNQHHLVLDPGLVLNYVSVQMKLKNYLPALQLLKAHWNTLSKTETVWQRAQVMHVFCLIFLNRCAEAQQCIPKVSTKHSEFLRRYYRYAQIAIYYQVQDYEAALNEAEAFAKYLMRHAKNPSVTHDKKLINFYIRLIKMKLHLTIRKPAISSLTQKFETALTKHEVQSDIYPTIWLRQELERLNAD
jgi:hypothetical protein